MVLARLDVPALDELVVLGRDGARQQTQQPAGTTGGRGVDDPVEVKVELREIGLALAQEPGMNIS